MCYIHLACRAAKQRRVHSCKRKRRSANSVAASLPRRSVAAPTVSQRGSRVAASQRRSANSVAASQRQQRRSVTPAASQRQQRRSVTGPTAASQRRSVAASQRRRPLAASQRRSVAAPPAFRASKRRSVAAPPASGSVTAQRRKPTFWPPLPLHWDSKAAEISEIILGGEEQRSNHLKLLNFISWVHHLPGMPQGWR